MVLSNLNSLTQALHGHTRSLSLFIVHCSLSMSMSLETFKTVAMFLDSSTISAKNCNFSVSHTSALLGKNNSFQKHSGALPSCP